MDAKSNPSLFLFLLLGIILLLGMCAQICREASGAKRGWQRSLLQLSVLALVVMSAIAMAAWQIHLTSQSEGSDLVYWRSQRGL